MFLTYLKFFIKNNIANDIDYGIIYLLLRDAEKNPKSNNLVWYNDVISPGGGIGRHVALKMLFRKEYQFKSGLGDFGLVAQR